MLKKKVEALTPNVPHPQSPVKAPPAKEPFSLRKVMRFSTAMKPQATPMSNHAGDADEDHGVTPLSLPGQAPAHSSKNLPSSTNTTLETELDLAKKANDDLKKTLEINKTLMNLLLKGAPNLEGSVKDGIWAMESLIAQSRAECADLKCELALRESKIEALKRHMISQETTANEQMASLKAQIERKEYQLQYKDLIWR